MSVRRLGIFVTHPIQYFVPLWRLLAKESGVELHVFFFSDHSVRGGIDHGFGVPVAWDVPLDGYTHTFLQRDADLTRPWSVRLPDPRGLLRKHALDAVLVHGYRHRFESQVIRAARQLGIRTLVRGEFTDDARPGRSALRAWARHGYLRWFLGMVDAFCVVGERARRDLRSRGISEDRLFFSPYAVDTALLEAQRGHLDRESVRLELGIPEGDVLLLFSGKLIPRKAPLLIVDALARIPDRARFWLACLGDGELRGALESAGRAVLGPRLLLPGFTNQSQLGRWFVAADAFILPSTFETWGLVVNEAEQFGLPVVVSDRVGSAADLVIPGETGFIFPSGDDAALAAMLEKLQADPAARRRMGERARQRVAAYSTEASANGILRALGIEP